MRTEANVLASQINKVDWTLGILSTEPEEELWGPPFLRRPFQMLKLTVLCIEGIRLTKTYLSKYPIEFMMDLLRRIDREGMMAEIEQERRILKYLELIDERFNDIHPYAFVRHFHKEFRALKEICEDRVEHYDILLNDELVADLDQLCDLAGKALPNLPSWRTSMPWLQ
ncbi:MAG: hypothetical protein HY788_08490 [Deltaproteobacteria bacterium]|nr:hypothetical protein [Deltaproteobacteria bacterium]